MYFKNENGDIAYSDFENDDREKAIIVGLQLPYTKEFAHSLEELESLCEACDILPVFTLTQALDAPHQALYIGTGKVDEVKEAAANLDADLIVFDDSLSPSQARNLNTEIGLPIMDRTALILEIFASRAQTREAKLQVELAKLQYLLPRLTGMGTAMSRQGGGSGSRSNKGAGEKKLELDKRYISHRITECKKELKSVKQNRQTQRKSRVASAIPQVALVGYTNAGKSTVMNQMLSVYGNDEINDNEHKKVLQQDMLFATLETTIRKITPENKPDFYLSDTVGFIDKLPHNLVDAFRSTLEEALSADLLIQVVDVSDPFYRQHMEVTATTLKELGAGDIPMIIAYNKADNVETFASDLPIVTTNHIHMAASKGIGIPELMDMILDELFGKSIISEYLIPYSQGSLLSQLLDLGNALEQDYRAEGTYIKLEYMSANSDMRILNAAAKYEIHQ
ncbi:MAG: GTPase HflX [Lachnospiraceae bacterium]|nr:GTPase HflX [Lachnospiraceae bacterium]